MTLGSFRPSELPAFNDFWSSNVETHSFPQHNPSIMEHKRRNSRHGSRKIRPDIVSYNLRIKLLGNAGQGAMALAEFREMPVPPDEITYVSTIRACSQVGRWDGVMELLAEIPSSFETSLHHEPRANEVGVTGTGKILKTALGALAESNQWQRSLFLLEEILIGRYGNVRSDESMFNLAMNACAEANRWKEALDLLEKLMDLAEKDEGRSMSALPFNTVMKACLRGSQPVRVSGLFKTMLNAGVKPDHYN